MSYYNWDDFHPDQDVDEAAAEADRAQAEAAAEAAWEAEMEWLEMLKFNPKGGS